MMIMKRTILAVIVLGSLLVTGLLTPGDTSKEISDKMLGLSKTSVFDTPAPEVTKTNESEPGELPLVKRVSPEEPPLVPHGLGEFLPITFVDNQCADCHGAEEEKIEGEATPIPDSHYTDLRNAPGKVQDTIVGARYNCVSCHVSPGGNDPLTGNTFGR
jgi:nitrate reductase cytochrome c-type subunit